MKIWIIFFILILYGCSNVGSAITSVPKETIPQPSIYFCPRNDCEKILFSYINNSKNSVHCAFYDLDLENISKLLAEKSKDIDVKLVMDNGNPSKIIGGKGIIYDTKSQLMHNKFCIFDNKIVFTGSMNPTENDAYKNNNNILIIDSKNLANNYELEFNELWNFNFGKGHKTTDSVMYLNNKKYINLFCPEDNCKDNVMNALNSAEESIYFMIFSFTDQDIADVLAAKKDQGLDVKGIVEAKRITMQYEQYNNLIEKDVFVIKDNNKYTLHHKVFIVDNQTVITGSYNPTSAADEKNDENILIINDRDIARLYLDEFNLLFN
jgi:phosphatidylserine/phosphatidylglycerophosphate/cardiolipin synthase-like enzyme